MLVSHIWCQQNVFCTNLSSFTMHDLYHMRVGLLEGEAQEKSRIGFLGLQENVESHVKTEQSKQQVVHIVYMLYHWTHFQVVPLYASSRVCLCWVAASNTGTHVHIAIYKKCAWLPSSTVCSHSEVSKPKFFIKLVALLWPLTRVIACYFLSQGMVVPPACSSTAFTNFCHVGFPNLFTCKQGCSVWMSIFQSSQCDYNVALHDPGSWNVFPVQYIIWCISISCSESRIRTDYVTDHPNTQPSELGMWNTNTKIME